MAELSRDRNGRYQDTGTFHQMETITLFFLGYGEGGVPVVGDIRGIVL